MSYLNMPQVRNDTRNMTVYKDTYNPYPIPKSWVVLKLIESVVRLEELVVGTYTLFDIG